MIPLNIWCKRITLCSLIVFFVRTVVQAQQCSKLATSDRLRLESFVAQWFKFPANQSLALAESDSVDAACYRKLIFRPSIPGPLLVLYLTPDKQHLVSNVLDLRVDPAITQRERQEELQRILERGAILTTGSKIAPAKLVVFSDFECPYCKQFSEIVDALTPEERSQLEIIYRQFPLDIHPWAREAAELTTCIALENKQAFWTAHRFLFAQQASLSKETLKDKLLDQVSRYSAVPPTSISMCLAQKSYEPALHNDIQLATDLGIRYIHLQLF